MTHALVLFSGGLDSTLALAWTLRQGHDVTVLEFDYPERPHTEREAARQVLDRLDVQQRLWIELPYPLRSPRAMPEGYLASRNLAFHGIAQSIAESIGASFVVAGHLERDGQSFPDARRAYFRAIEDLAARGRPFRRRIRIVNPLAGKGREQRMRLARRLQAPIELTWSCWYEGTEPCGRCEKCLERARLQRVAHPPLAALRVRTGRRPPRGSRASRR